MSRIIPFLAGFALCAILAASSIGLFAQGDSLARFTPFVIDVSQAVPVEVSIPVVEGGETVSKTVPLTVSVALQVRVDGPQDATVEVVEAPPPVVAVATATPVAEVDSDNPLDTFEVSDWEGEQVVELEGVEITLTGISLTDWQAMLADDDESTQEMVEYFAQKGEIYGFDVDAPSLLGIIGVSVTNLNDMNYSASPSSNGVVVIGSEQIDLNEFQWASQGDDVDGEILPGVVKEGVLVFWANRTTVEDIKEGTNFVLQIDRPTIDYQFQGEEDFMFKVELPN